MKISYDSEVNALSIVFIDTTVTTTQIAEGVAIDYAEDGRVAGIEILDAPQSVVLAWYASYRPDAVRPGSAARKRLSG